MKGLFKLMLIGSMLLSGVFVSNAQPGSGRGGQMNPAEMAKRQADEMQQAVKLTEAQYDKVLAVFKEQSESMQKLMQSGQRPDQAAMTKIREDQEKKLKEILTEEQFKKWQDAQANRRGMGGPRGPGFK